MEVKDTYLTIACLCQRRREPMLRVNDIPNRYQCPVCHLEVTLFVEALPEAWYEENWRDESLSPFCHACHQRMEATNTGCGRGQGVYAGRYFNVAAFVCRGTERHVVSGYCVEVSKEEYEELGRQAMANWREMQEKVADQLVQGALLEAADPVRATIKMRTRKREDGVTELDLGGLSTDEKEHCVAECQYLQRRGLVHDLQVTENTIIYRMDPLLAEKLTNAAIFSAIPGSPNKQ